MFGSSGGGTNPGSNQGGSGGQPQTGGIFGGPTTTASFGGSSVFGQASSNTGFGQSAGFGQSTTTGFGQSSGTSAFGQSAFGQTTGSFGQNPSGGFGQSPGFGQGTSTTASTFGPGTSSISSTGGFGSGGGNMFGQSSGQSGFGQSAGSTTSATTGGFGAGLTSGTPVFGATTSSTASSSGAFGQKTTTAPTVFGGVKKPAAFGAVTPSSTLSDSQSTSTIAPSIFGSPKQSTTPDSMASNIFSSGRRTPSTPATVAASIFGGSKVFGAKSTEGSPPAGSKPSAAPRQLYRSASLDDKSTPPTPDPTPTATTQTTSVFGASKPSTGTVFGSQTTTSKNLFGAAKPEGSQPSSKPIFGSSEASSKSVFGGKTTKTVFGAVGQSEGPTFSVAFRNPDEQSQGSDKPAVQSSVFGAKSIDSSSQSKAPSLFGKPASSSENEKKDDEEDRRRGRRWRAGGRAASPAEEAESGEDKPRRRLIRRADKDIGGAKPTGLFGKALSGAIADKTPLRITVSKDQEGKQVDTVDEDEPEDSSPTGSEKRALVRRRSSIVDVAQQVALNCQNIPTGSCTAAGLRRHFVKFGKVTRVFPNPRKNSAVVHFDTHDDALNAKKKGRVMRPGAPAMQIFWSTYTKGKGSPEQGKIEDSSSRRERSSAKHRSRSFGASENSELEEELASMQGTSDISSERVTFLDRPGDLQTHSLTDADSVPPPREVQRARARRSQDGTTARPRSHSPSTQARDNRKEARPRSSSPVPSLMSLPLKRDRAEQDKKAVQRLPIKRPTSPAPRSASPTPAITQVPAKPQPATSSKGGKFVSFRSLMDSVGHNAGECYEILEKRDKLIREVLDKHRKQQNLATASVIRGTCPDLCPEKERYVREERRRLTMYEVADEHTESGQPPRVDHARALKEYSRSSADQEMPLPHELRPGPVLERTMDYLCNNILDAGRDGDWADWYEFVWSRTRGIRKDITQQQLCDQTSVSLVEKCARFHIYCSHHLCEEDMMTFDAKINNENLTKCLQTLKEFYHDMCKKGLHCPQEPEFRAYMVLMNLNEGETLREVQELPESIRSDPRVVFALKAYSALNSNNYIKFFKLVRQASFLPACILHRYFNQVWRKALLIMLKVYSIPGKPTQYQLSILVRQLGFEDESEAAEFCQHHGLMTDTDTVSMERTRFVEPEAAFPPRRAPNIIDSKQHTSVGEVVNGDVLPPNIIENPTSSFDKSGRFIVPGITINLGDEEDGAQSAEPSTSQVIPQQLTAEQQKAEELVKSQFDASPYTNEDVKDIARGMFLEVIDDMVNNLTGTCMAACHTLANVFAPEILNNSLAQNIPVLTKQVAIESIEDVKREKLEVEARERLKREKMEQEARQRAEMARLRDQLGQAVVQQVTEEVLNDGIREMATEVYRDTQLHLESKDRCIKAVTEELYESCLHLEFSQLINQFYNVEVVKRRQTLAELQRAVELTRMARYFRKWRNEDAGRQRLKRSMLTFPPAPSTETASQQLQRLLPDSEGLVGNSVHLGKKARLTTAAPPELLQGRHLLAKNITAFRFLQLVRHQKAWAPCDLPKVVLPGLIGDKAQKTRSSVKDFHVYWKLLMSMPEKTNSEDLHDRYSNEISDWVRAKLKSGAVQDKYGSSKTKLLSLYTSDVLVGSPGRPVSIHVCVRAAQGCLSDDDVADVTHSRSFYGTSGLIFLLPQPPEGVKSKTWWINQKTRLSQLLESRPSDPSIPVLVIICSHLGIQGAAHVTPGMAERHLGLHDLIDLGPVSDFKIIEIEADFEEPIASSALESGLAWLSDFTPEPPRLHSQTLTDLVEDACTKEFSVPVYQDLALRRHHGQLDQGPDTLLCLYNAVVSHLVEAVSHDDLRELSWPITEFAENHKDLPSAAWNDDTQLSNITDLVLSLSLPDFEYQALTSDEWDTACQDVWAYVSAVTEDTDVSSVKLISRVEWLLRKAKADFDDLTCLLENIDPERPYYVNMPWTDIIMACVDHKLAALRQAAGMDGDPVMVHVLPDQLEAFTPPQGWKQACVIHVKEPVTLEQTVVRAAKRKQEESVRASPPKYVRTQESSSEEEELDLSPANPKEVEAKQAAQELKAELLQERKKMDAFESMLQNALSAGEGVDMGTEAWDDRRRFSYEPNERLSIDLDPVRRYSLEPGRRAALDTSRRFSPDVTRSSPAFTQACSVQRQDPSRRLFQGLTVGIPTDTMSWTGLSQLPGASRSFQDTSPLARVNTTDINVSQSELLSGKKPSPSLKDTLVDLNTSLDTEKHANKLYEMRLRALLAEDANDLL